MVESTFAAERRSRRAELTSQLINSILGTKVH